MRLAIFDLDNCISNDYDRIPLIDWSQANPDKRYDRYHMMCGHDTPSNLALLHAIAAGLDTIAFCTARPESVRSTTMRWLRQNTDLRCLYQPQLLMRPSSFHIKSAELKAQMVAQLRGAGHSIAGAFDDREDVVRMYMELRIPAARLWIHDVCAMTNPNKEAEHA